MDSSTNPAQWRPLLFGVRLSPLTLDGLATQVLHPAASAPGQSVFTMNLDHSVRLPTDRAFQAAYADATFVVADGAPIVAAARWLNVRVAGRVAGIDLLENVLQQAGPETGVFFLGASAEVLDRLRSRLESRLPCLRIAGVHHGYFDLDTDTLTHGIAGLIRQSRARIVVVGMGSPRQEIWISRNRRQLTGTSLLAVGGSLEVLAGDKSRAPAWMQSCGLEWSWRVLQEPVRLWRRYLVGGLHFLPLLYREWRLHGRVRTEESSHESN